MTVGVVTSKQGTDIGPLINAAAARHLLATRALTAQLISESNLDEQAERYGRWPDVSFGLAQQTVAYANVGDGTNSPENIALVRAYYFDPAHAIEECAQQLGYYWGWFAPLDDESRFYEASSRYNGGPRLAFKDNPNQANIKRGWAQAAQYEREDTMPDDTATATYDPSVERVAQTDDWSCSCAAATWALRSLGVTIDYRDLEQRALDAGIVSTADGLRDATGGPLADWLAAEFGLAAAYDAGIRWDWLVAHAGQFPILLGGRRWGVAGHWVAVRDVDEDGMLALANPAEGYGGVFETLTERQFANVGPCSAVWLGREEDMARIADLEQQVAASDSLVGVLKDAGRVARENIEQALAVEGLPAAAQDALANGALPAVQTVERGAAPADGG